MLEADASCQIVRTSSMKHSAGFVKGIPWEFLKKFLGDNWLVGCSTGFKEGKSNEEIKKNTRVIKLFENERETIS